MLASGKTHRFIFLQGSVGQMGPPGAQGLPGEGIQGQKVTLSAVSCRLKKFDQ